VVHITPVLQKKADRKGTTSFLEKSVDQEKMSAMGDFLW